MAATYTVVPGTLGRFMREEMSNIINEMAENPEDPVLREVVLNTSAVRTVNQMGRPPAGTKTAASQFQAMHIFEFGEAGLIQYAKMGNTLGSDDAIPPMLAEVTYPDVTQAPQSLPEWALVDLKWIVGTLGIDVLQELALKSSTVVGPWLQRTLAGPLRKVHRQQCRDFFGSGYGTLATVKATTASVGAGATQAVTLNHGVRSFARGMRVTMWANNSGVPGGTQRGGDWIVTAVHNATTDPTITLYNASGGAATPTILDHIVLKGAWDGTTAYGMLGLDNFTDNTQALHGISKTTYPELKSVSDSNSGTLRLPTPLLIEKNFDNVFDRGWEPPDRAVTTRGVRTLYYLQQAALLSLNTDAARPVQPIADGGIGGRAQITVEHGVVPIMISAFCPKNTLYLYRLDKLVRYAPGGADMIQFLADSELLGGGGMFLPHVNGSGIPTTIREAPFNVWGELACLGSQCFGKISDLKEAVNV